MTVWGLVLMMLLVLAVNVLEGIVTKPVVQSSRESNVPAWLTLPTMGCFAMGLTLLYANSSVLSAQTEQSWVGALFLASGSLFLVAAILGWAISAVSILNSRDKQNKKIGVLLFIGIMTINAILVGKTWSLERSNDGSIERARMLYECLPPPRVFGDKTIGAYQ